MLPTVSSGGVSSTRVAYVTLATFPHVSVPVTVTTALHVPAVEDVRATALRQSSVAVVAAIAAASAAAAVA